MIDVIVSGLKCVKLSAEVEEIDVDYAGTNVTEDDFVATGRVKKVGDLLAVAADLAGDLNLLCLVRAAYLVLDVPITNPNHERIFERGIEESFKRLVIFLGLNKDDL